MERFPLFLVALLALCVVPSALAIKCYMCSNIPGYTLGSPCSADKVKTIECDPLADKCMTIQGTLNVNGSYAMDILLKNCSSTLVCNPTSPMSMCNIFNMTGMMSKCNTDCCEGDLCNGPSGAIRISGFLTTSAAILLTVILNLLSGFY